MKLKLIPFLITLLIAAALSACQSPASDVPVPAQTQPAEPAAATLPPPTEALDPAARKVEGESFTVEVQSQTLEVALAAAREGADFSGLEIHAWPLGDVALVLVEDPSGQYASRSEFFFPDPDLGGKQGLWLSDLANYQGSIDLLDLPRLDPSSLELIETTLTEDFMENTLGSLDEKAWYSLITEVDGSGELPETVNVYQLPFENGWLLEAVQKTSLLDLIFGVSAAHAQEFSSFTYIRDEGVRLIMEDGARHIPTRYFVPELIKTVHIWGIRGNLNGSVMPREYIGMECNNRNLASLKIELAGAENSSWVNTGPDFEKDFAVASSPAVGDLWYEIEVITSQGGNILQPVEGSTLKVWYCESVIEDVEMDQPVAQCEGDNCQILTIENPQGTQDSITLVGPQLYTFDIPPGTNTFALESGSYNFSITMCNGDWVSSGTLDPTHRWLIGMPNSCEW